MEWSTSTSEDSTHTRKTICATMGAPALRLSFRFCGVSGRVWGVDVRSARVALCRSGSIACSYDNGRQPHNADPAFSVQGLGMPAPPSRPHEDKAHASSRPASLAPFQSQYGAPHSTATTHGAPHGIATARSAAFGTGAPFSHDGANPNAYAPTISRPPSQHVQQYAPLGQPQPGQVVHMGRQGQGQQVHDGQ